MHPDEKKPIDAVLISASDINDYTSFLMGKVLTIVEAAIVDPVQRNAVKSVVGSTLRQENYIFQGWIIDSAQGKGSNFPFPRLAKK